MSNLKLLYSEPADIFPKALPIGNGNVGATIFGGINQEKIVFNNDTLYSGFPHHIDASQSYVALPKIRDLIFKGKIKEAEKVIEENFPNENNNAYQTVGNLILDFDNEANSVTDYSRYLDIENAIHTVKYKVDGAKCKRESFVSAPDKVFVMKITSDRVFSFAITFESEMKHKVVAEEDRITAIGFASDRHWPQVEYKENKGMQYKSVYRIKAENGEIKSCNDKLIISNTNSVIIYALSETSFNGFNNMPNNKLNSVCKGIIDKAYIMDYEKLKERHILDYKRYFDRCSFTLFAEDKGEIPLPERVKAKNRNDVAELMFAYGRYLLISSSRPGTQPANLQGIWNDKQAPPFASAYTMNINTPMQYWMAEETNLAELAEPLFNFIDELSQNGKITAREFYNCSGWCSHHNIDIWRKTAPFVGMKNATRWGMWPMSGVWIVKHYYENYLFSNNISNLKKAYPAIKGAAEFCSDFLIEYEGFLVTNPSTSPENIYYDRDGNVCAASVMTALDNTLIREVFIMLINSSQILGVDRDFANEIKGKLTRLLPFNIKSDGSLGEWFKDYKEAAEGISHISPMYGAFPGDLFTKDIELYNAAKKYLDNRIKNIVNRKGWGIVWRTALFARFKNKSKCEENIDFMTANYDYPLYISNKFLQCDFAMGVTAAISEMLLQSYKTIEILPCIPEKWDHGKITGIRARGGFLLDIEWNYNVADVTVYSTTDNVFTLGKANYKMHAGQTKKLKLNI